MRTSDRTKMMVTTALMAAMVFVATYLIKIPNPTTGGYSHLGDCMIFLSVMMLGRRNGAIAAALGGALSDLLAGAAIWVLPTLCIKAIMAWIMGTIVGEHVQHKGRLMTGAVVGGLFQIAAYTLVKVVLVGVGPAVASIPNVSIQTLVGIVLFAGLAAVLSKYIPRLTGRKDVAH